MSLGSQFTSLYYQHYISFHNEVSQSCIQNNVMWYPDFRSCREYIQLEILKCIISAGRTSIQKYHKCLRSELSAVKACPIWMRWWSSVLHPIERVLMCCHLYDRVINWFRLTRFDTRFCTLIDWDQIQWFSPEGNDFQQDTNEEKHK